MGAAAKDISVALSGSGFLYPIHIGALLALEEKYNIKHLSGTSGGSIVAGLYKVIGDATKLEELTYAIDFENFMDFSSWWNIFRLFGSKSGYTSSEYLEKFLKKQTKGKLLKEIPNLSICATDLIKKEKAIFNSVNTPEVPVYRAILASASIPFVYPVTYINNIPYVDGGVTDNIPVDTLPTEGLRFAIQVLDKETPPKIKDKLSLWDVGEYTLGALLNRQEEIDLKLNPGTHIIGVSAGPYSFLDTKLGIKEKAFLVEQGYKCTREYINKNNNL